MTGAGACRMSISVSQGQKWLSEAPRNPPRALFRVQRVGQAWPPSPSAAQPPALRPFKTTESLPMGDAASLVAELRQLARPHALVRRPDVRRDLLLDLAKRLETFAATVTAPPPKPVRGDVGVRTIRDRRVTVAVRGRASRLDPMEELRRILQAETAEI